MTPDPMTAPASASVPFRQPRSSRPTISQVDLQRPVTEDRVGRPEAPGGLVLADDGGERAGWIGAPGVEWGADLDGLALERGDGSSIGVEDGLRPIRQDPGTPTSSQPSSTATRPSIVICQSMSAIRPSARGATLLSLRSPWSPVTGGFARASGQQDGPGSASITNSTSSQATLADRRPSNLEEPAAAATPSPASRAGADRGARARPSADSAVSRWPPGRAWPRSAGGGVETATASDDPLDAGRVRRALAQLPAEQARSRIPGIGSATAVPSAAAPRYGATSSWAAATGSPR